MSRPGLHHGDGPLAEIAFWGLLFLIAWAPLPLASNRPWSMNFLVLIAALLLFTWACAVLQRPSLFNVPISRILVPGIPFLCVLIWSLIQTTSLTPAAWHNPIWQETAAALGRPVRGAISIDPAASINATLRLFSYGAVFLIAAQFGRRTSRARILIWCVAIVTIAYSAYGVAIFYSGNRTILWFEKWAYLDDLTSTFVARASFGAYAGIGMLTVLALAFDAGTGASERRDRSLGGLLEALPPSFYLLVISVLLLAVTVLLTHSRGAVVVTALGVAVMMVMLIARYRERRRLLLTVSVAMAIAGFAVLEISGGGTLGRTLALAEEGTGRDSIHALTDKAISESPSPPESA